MKDELLMLAEEAKVLYRANLITREEAKARIKPYADYYNETAARIAKKYNRKPQKFSFSAFMR
jgi:hypothetical protein